MKNIFKVLCSITLCLMLCGCGSVKLDDGKNAIVTFDDGGITAQDLYDKLKSTYASDQIVNMIDSYLLNKKYETSTDETKYVNNAVKSAEDAASKYNIDFDTYVKYYYGVASKSAFKDYIALQYKRTLWISDYAKETVTETQINDYYKDEYVGDMTLSHILITVDGNKDTDAYNKAKEVIEKLNNGSKFEDLVKEYSEDDATKDNKGSLGKVNDGDYNDAVIDAAKELEVGKYTTSPVKSSYGYHIIYKEAQDEKKELTDEVKTTITETIAKQIANEDTFYARALIALREKNNMKFVDGDLEKIYNDVVNK